MKSSKVIKNTINVIILLFYLVAHIVLISHHEAWGDEAQAWNIAKNTSLIDLFPALCAEGHPAGWFLVIKLFQLFGMSFYNFSYLSLFLMFCALGVFLFFSPLPLYANVIVSLSSCFCYFNPVISRVYALAILLIVLISCFYEKRKEASTLFGILVLILFQTHILLAGFACSLMIVVIYDAVRDKKLYPAVILSVLGFAATVLELFPRSTVTKSVDYSMASIFSNISFDILIDRFNLFPNTLFTSLSTIWWGLFLVSSILSIVLMFLSLKKNLDILFIGLCSFGFIICVNFFIYRITIHAATLLIALSLFVTWILYPRVEKNTHKIIVLASLLIISFGSIHTWVRSARSDYLRDFSENKKMADYICSNLDNNSVIIMKDEELARAGVYAYVTSKRPDIIFWCPDTNNEYTFYNWSTTISPIDNENAVLITKTSLPNANDIYLLSWHEENSEILKLIFAANDYCEKNDPSWLYAVN